mmetsp:Transcript_23771/g.61753  ORF Transcript_23771/g.61753 Transcript_23771/m.61753 type:complete len:272 (-) Transcript_23771:1218-2033(-)
MGMGSASSPASGASVRCCFSASAPAVASSCFLFLGRSAWMASGGFCGHFAHHFAWLGFCPGRKNCGVAAWPHTQNLLTTSTASAGFIGHRWHQRAAFLGSPGRAYIGVPRAPHTHRFFTRTALAGLDGHLMHQRMLEGPPPGSPRLACFRPHSQRHLPTGNASGGMSGQRVHHFWGPRKTLFPLLSTRPSVGTRPLPQRQALMVTGWSGRLARSTAPSGRHLLHHCASLWSCPGSPKRGLVLWHTQSLPLLVLALSMASAGRQSLHHSFTL